MSALLLHPIDARAVPFSHIPLGGLFYFQGRFYTRISGADGRPVARRNREPATRLFVGAMVQEVQAMDSDHWFITEFLERGTNGDGTTLSRMPISEWPAWAADLQRELFPVEPRPAVHRERSRSAALGRVLTSLGVLLAAILLAPLRAIRARLSRSRDPGAEFAPLHDWKCDHCGAWNPDWRDEEPCPKCEADRPDICEYRKHVP